VVFCPNRSASTQRYLPQGLAERILAQRDKIEGERRGKILVAANGPVASTRRERR
jgi:hypothetical protein